MNDYPYSFQRELSEKQHVIFIIDPSEDFSAIEQLKLSKYPKVFLFVDTIVFELYQNVIDKLNSMHKQIILTKIESNENAKNISLYGEYVQILSDGACSKKDLLLAVGGGVVLDVISFLASTYMRGVNLIMIPTTLIGQTDASTAGKTCMNTDASKNLLGTFFLPKIVYNNIHFLKTCSEHSLRQGFSELFKYGLLDSQELINLIVKFKDSPDDLLMSHIIKVAIGVRFDIRTYNPLASNLGHTFGHALEISSNYRVSHGDAISIGIVMALRFSLEKGLVMDNFFTRVISWMKKLELNTFIDSDTNPEEIATLMCNDKKSHDDMIGLILIKDVACPIRPDEQPFNYVEKDEMERYLKEFISDSNYVKKNHWNHLSQNGN